MEHNTFKGGPVCHPECFVRVCDCPPQLREKVNGSEQTEFTENKNHFMILMSLLVECHFLVKYPFGDPPVSKQHSCQEYYQEASFGGSGASSHQRVDAYGGTG